MRKQIFSKNIIIVPSMVLFFVAICQLMGMDSVLKRFIPDLSGVISNPVNYIAFSLAVLFLILGFTKIELPLKAIAVFIGLILIYTFNYFVAPYSLWSWYKYQMAFFITSATVCCYIYSGGEVSQALFVIFIVALLYVAVMSIYMLSQVGISTYVLEYNRALNILDDQDINEKQKFGNLLAFVLIYSAISFKNGMGKLLLIGGLLFLGVGIRTMMIGLLATYFLMNYKSLYKTVIYAVPVVIGAVALLPKYFELNELIYGTRFYSYANAFNIISNFDNGVGLGGYSIYTEDNNDLLLSRFYDSDAIFLLLPTATESDIVFYISSFGYLGVVLLFLLFSMIILYAIRYPQLDKEGKIFVAFFSFMFFAGISQDNAFFMSYWIFFGAALGVYLNQSRLALVSQSDF